MSELANIQRWFTSILIKPGGLDEKIAMADEHYGIDSLKTIRPTEDLPARKRIWIYAGGYIQRLLECMEAEYPVLHHLLGEELFNTFARAYLLHFPSHSPDLYDLGKNFPGFLKASQPPGLANQDTDAAPYDLPVDIACVERAVSEVMRSKGTESEEMPHIQSDDFLMFSTSLSTPPCLQLLQTGFSLVEYINDVQHSKDAPIPAKKDCLIAISRKNYAINMHELEAWQWHFLQALQNTNDYTAAVATTAELTKIPKDSLLADLMLWVPAAMSLGYVTKA